ncbi:MAG TPA: hypothetical protein PLM93_12015 [Sulfuricurvum sp.]|nr:MAG: hypothetical protein B7X89_11460 [Sulfuricurvum sp. 17-40-25]HQS67902.1 hypothetical protein [Sulfuricurvum sp.]HQT37771.1 hypothetical protein [Sulfuricurvum sp.]
MNRSVTLLLIIGMSALNAQDIAPVSPNAAEGKTVYIPIAKPVNLYEEVDIQKEDQNTTKLGSAK